MNGLAENSLTSIDPGQLILASPDGGWCDQVEAALMASDDLTGLVTWRVKQLCQLDLFLQLPSGDWRPGVQLLRSSSCASTVCPRPTQWR